MSWSQLLKNSGSPKGSSKLAQSFFKWEKKKVDVCPMVVLVEGCDRMLSNREKWKTLPEKKVNMTMTTLTELSVHINGLRSIL